MTPMQRRRLPLRSEEHFGMLYLMDADGNEVAFIGGKADPILADWTAFIMECVNNTVKEDQTNRGEA